MDSEDSRPGSSASNTSSNSSDNSRPSSPINEENNSKYNTLNYVTSSEGREVNRNVRLRSRGSNEGSRSIRSISKSDSKSNSDCSSSSSSSDNEIENPKSPTKSKGSSGRSSSIESLAGKIQSPASPSKSQKSFRDSRSSSNRSRSNSCDKFTSGNDVKISHEDLSDVSDMESEKRINLTNANEHTEDGIVNASLEEETVNDNNTIAHSVNEHSNHSSNSAHSDVITDLRQKLDQKKNQLKVLEGHQPKSGVSGEEASKNISSIEDLVRAPDEDALDFEAEEGECQDIVKDEENKLQEDNVGIEKEKKKLNNVDGSEGNEELEEGEVSDEDEKRPEETEPKPVCRFYTRGQCTWGMSCRFLHPGVTDKGNYTMFDLIRPVPMPQPSSNGTRPSNYGSHNTEFHDYRNERPTHPHRAPIHHSPASFSGHHDPRSIISDGPIVVESAWERGLRTAKEMMRKANKRKEQDMDFEDKKMNLTLSPDELEKEPYFLKERGSPTDAILPYGRHGVYQEAPADIYSPPDRFGRGPPVPPYEEVDPYGRTTRYRELPPHRMPHYEDERRVRPTREVIVQRVEPVNRGDEWNDPWMRSKSPGGRGVSRDRGNKRRKNRHSYSSNSSYSTSSNSQTDSSSESSRSITPVDHRRRYKSPLLERRHGIRNAQSPSPQQHRSRHSPSLRQSPPSKRRGGHVSPLPVQDKRNMYATTHKRKKLSPVLKKTMNDKSKVKRRHTSSSSGSGSSDSSGSDSESDSASSSSESSSRSRGHTPMKRSRVSEKLLKDKKTVKRVEPPKKRSPISIEIKKQNVVGASAFASPTNSNTSEKDPKKSRREELLKQLRAVEDAIAKKRSKLV